MSNIVGRFPAVVRPNGGSCRSRTSVMRFGITLALGGWTGILFSGDLGPRGRSGWVAERLRRRGRADPGPALPGLPFRRRPEGEARPLAARLGVRGRGERRGDRRRQARREPALGAGRGRTRCRRRRRLSDAEKAAIQGWIAGGAAWGTDPIDPYRLTTDRRAGRDWWSLQPVRRAEPPAVARRGWSRSPIDAFVLTKLEAERTDAGPRGRPPDADPPAELRPDRAAADARGGRRVPGRPLGPTPMNGWSIATSPRRSTACDGRGGGSTWPASARATASNSTSSARTPGAIATGWSTRSTATCPTTSSPGSSSPATCSGPTTPRPIEATGFLVAGAYDTAGQNQISAAMKAVVRERRAGGHRRHGRPDVPRPDGQLRPLPRPQVRPDPPGGILPARLGPRAASATASATCRRSIPRRSRCEATDRGGSSPGSTAIEAPARARSGPSAKTAAGRPRAEPIAAWDFDRGLDDRIGSLQVDAPGRRDARRRRACASTARRATPSTAPLLARPEGQDDRGLGPARQSRPARRRRRSASRRPTGDASTPSSSASRKPGRWMAGSEGFSPHRSVGGEPRPRRPTGRSTSRSPTPRTARSGSSATAGPMARPTSRRARSRFRRARPRSSSACVTRRPAATGCWPARSCGPGSTTGRSTDAEVAASAATFGDYVDPAAIAAGPARRAPRGARPAASARSSGSGHRWRLSHARLTPSRRARPASTRIQIRGNPAQPGDVVAAGRGRGRGRARRRLRPAARRPRGRAAEAAGRLDHRPAQPAVRPGHRQPALAGPFRHGPGRDAERLRLQRRPPVAPRAARLAGLRDGRARLEPQGDAPADRHLGRLSPVVAARTRRRSSATRATACSGGRPRSGWRPRWSATRCSPSRARSTRSSAARASATTTIVKAAGHARHPLPPVDPARPGLDRRTLYRAWARGGRSALARRLRLPRPLDHRAAAGRHDHAAPGPGADEQRPGPPPVRRLRRPAAPRGRARRRPAGRARLPAGLRPRARARRAGAGRRASSSDSARPRSPGRSSTATSSSTSIDRARPGGRHGPSRVLLLGPERPGRRGGGVADAPRRHARRPACPARRARPARTSPRRRRAPSTSASAGR